MSPIPNNAPNVPFCTGGFRLKCFNEKQTCLLFIFYVTFYKAKPNNLLFSGNQNCVDTRDILIIILQDEFEN